MDQSVERLKGGPIDLDREDDPVMPARPCRHRLILPRFDRQPDKVGSWCSAPFWGRRWALEPFLRHRRNLRLMSKACVIPKVRGRTAEPRFASLHKYSSSFAFLRRYLGPGRPHGSTHCVYLLA